MRAAFIIISILFVNSLFCNAQEVSVAMNYSFTGRNCALTYNKYLNKSEFGLGLRYNINMWAHPDDQANVFYKRQYATKDLHHIGLQAYYHRYFWSMIFAFYDVQFSYSKTFNRMYLPSFFYDPSVENPTRDDMLYKKHLEYFGPFTWLEQYVGVGLKFNITESIILRQKAGIGVNLLFGSDQKLPDTVLRKVEVGYGLLFNIGLAYKF